MFFFMFSLQAYEFDVVIRNNSAHQFSIIRNIETPSTLISDTQYFSDIFNTLEILPKREVRCYITLSIKDYITSSQKRDSIFFKNSTGSFFVTFSKAKADVCPVPILLDSEQKRGRHFDMSMGMTLFWGELFVPAEEIVDGDYKMVCYFDKNSKEYIVDIRDK